MWTGDRARIRDALLSVALAAAALAPAPPACAATPGTLPLADWPETRRDAARSGRSLEDVVADPGIGWFSTPGDPIFGEIAVAGCSVYAGTAGGAVRALDARTGAEAWRTTLPWTLAPTNAASALAADPTGTIAAGLPGDAGLLAIWRATSPLCTALESYAVDHGTYPPGPDLAPDLVPVYLSAMPWNPIQLRLIRASAAPSAGDYLYARDATGTTYHIGLWWSDGRLVPAIGPCEPPDPTWALSPIRGGLPSAFDARTGSPLWTDATIYPAMDAVPATAPWGLLWTTGEERPLAYDFPNLGRVRATRLDGTLLWETRAWAPLRGGAARNERSGDVFAARGPSHYARYLTSVLRTLGTAVESYQVDNGFVPRAADPTPFLVPIFLRELPQHPVEERPIAFSPTPSAGDFDYTLLPPSGYELAIWDEVGSRAAVFRDGVLAQAAADRPPAVFALDAGGSLRWRAWVGTTSEDLTGPAARDDGAVVVATRSGDVLALAQADGSQLWRTTIGGTISAPVALLPDGGVVVMTESGDVAALDPAGGPRWRYRTGAAAEAAPTATADGSVYAPGLDGTLRAIDPAGALLWQLPLGGALRAGLTTAAATSDEWIFVGRADGAVAAVASIGAADLPADLGNALRAVRDLDDVVFCLVAPPAACSYNVRKSAARAVLPADPLVAHAPPDAPRDRGGVAVAPAAAYYRMYGVACCTGTQGG